MKLMDNDRIIKPRRQALLFGGAAMAAAIPGGRKALADTPFTSFTYPLSTTPGGPTTPRTTLQRFSDLVFNVKDFGAVGNGATNDAAAINRTLAACFAAGGGRVYFPLGQYWCGSTSIVCPATPGGAVGVTLLGAGGQETDYTLIRGNNTGYVVNLTPGTPVKPGVTHVEKLHIQNISTGAGGLPATAGGCLKIGDGTIVGVVRDCRIEPKTGVGINTSFTAGNAGAAHIYNCEIIGDNTHTGTVGIVCQQSVIEGVRIHALDTGIWADNSGITVVGCSFEVLNRGLYLGRAPDDTPSQITAGFFSGLTFESNVTSIQCSTIGHSFFSGIHIHAFTGSCFNGANPQYGIELDNVWNTVFSGISIGGNHTQYGIWMGDYTDGVIFDGVTAQSGAVAYWGIPANNQSGIRRLFTCRKCNTSDEVPYALLPTSNRFVGDEYNVSNANANTFGANVTAAGAPGYHVKVRWNGAHWTVMGV
jgi:Pectate lyase superfamily protein